MIVKLCNKCKAPIKYPNSYCPKCKELYEEQVKQNTTLSNRRYNQNRDKKYLRFYKSPEWDLLKNKKLQDTQYKCEYEGCKKLAEDVHHIIEIKDDWDKRLDYDNLMSLCVEHHNKMHNRFQKRK